jgi:hypothetical protein
VPVGFSCAKDMTAQQLIDQVRRAGGEVILAHPYWCGRTIQQIADLNGLAAIEVYNSTCRRIGKADSTVVWDYLLATGVKLPAVGVDDAHATDDLFGSWTMLRVQEPTTEGVMQALRTGAFYASCGPEILDFSYANGTYRLSCSPVAEISFIGRGAQGRSIRATGGGTIHEALWTASSELPYVRAMVTDIDGRRAWTQPFVHAH